MKVAQGTERDESLDFIKSIAIILVISVHITAVGFVYPDGHWWDAAVFYRGIASLCVPLFFMVTGALLLSRPAPIRVIFNRIWRVTVPLILWSLIYLSWNVHIEHEHVDSWLERILVGGSEAHLWFVYAIIGAYIFLPMLSTFYQNSNAGQRALFLSAWFVGASLSPFFKAYYSITLTGIDLSYAPLYSGYMVLGAVLYEWSNARKSLALTIVVAILGAASAAAMVMATRLWHTNHGGYTMMFYEYWSPLVIFFAACSFVSIKMLYVRIKVDAVRQVSNAISSRTLGIYFCHMIFLKIMFLVAQGGFIFMDTVGVWAWFPLATGLTVLVSFIFTWLIQKIPVARWLCPG